MRTLNNFQKYTLISYKFIKKLKPSCIRLNFQSSCFSFIFCNPVSFMYLTGGGQSFLIVKEQKDWQRTRVWAGGCTPCSVHLTKQAHLTSDNRNQDVLLGAARSPRGSSAGEASGSQRDMTYTACLSHSAGKANSFLQRPRFSSASVFSGEEPLWSSWWLSE